MNSQSDIPQVRPQAILATFEDERSAVLAIRSLLDSGFEENQVSLIPLGSQEASPANDPATYRATGLRYSPALQDLDHAPSISEDPPGDSKDAQYPMVMVQPAPGEETAVKQLLKRAGGQIAKEPGREAA